MSKYKNIKKRILKELLFWAVLFIALLVVYLILGKNCPIRIFFKINCPFCGMTRAHLAALRLDFKSAFNYHPLFFLGVPYLFWITHPELLRKRETLYNIITIVLTVLFLICYFVRNIPIWFHL